MFTKNFIGRVVIIAILGFSFVKISYARVIVVDSSGAGDYTVIQEAVANADSGDTVFVRKGTYFAPTLQDTFPSIDLNVSLCLLGEDPDSTIILGYPALDDGFIRVMAPGCRISGFTIKSGGMPTELWAYGIHCYSTSPMITNNNFYTLSFPGSALVHHIYCSDSSSPIIHYNNFYSCSFAIWLENDPLDIDAENNYWGTTEESEIRRKIWDGNDENGLGIVDYVPWLENPYSVGVASCLDSHYFYLDQNYPNPFNTITTINYCLRKPDQVTLSIYDASGREIRRLVEETQRAEEHVIIWDGKDHQHRRVPSGIYWLKLQLKDHFETRKLVVVK